MKRARDNRGERGRAEKMVVILLTAKGEEESKGRIKKAMKTKPDNR